MEEYQKTDGHILNPQNNVIIFYPKKIILSFLKELDKERKYV